MRDEPFISGAEDSPSMHFDIEDDKKLQTIGIGRKVRVEVTGTVKSVRAPEMQPDYDVESKPGKKRPMKKCPGSICVELDKKPQITPLQEINDALRSMDE